MEKENNILYLGFLHHHGTRKIDDILMFVTSNSDCIEWAQRFNKAVNLKRQFRVEKVTDVQNFATRRDRNFMFYNDMETVVDISDIVKNEKVPIIGVIGYESLYNKR